MGWDFRRLAWGCLGRGGFGFSPGVSICRDRLGLWVKNLTAVTRVNFAWCTFVYSFTF